MNLEDIRRYCASKKGNHETFPFDEETLVIRVASKMYLLTNINSKDLSISLKCDPFMAQDLRRDFEAITAGYHLNKKHWITVAIDGSIEEDKIYYLIDLSYELVYKGLKKAEKLLLQ